jgi:hypothetical protein
MWPTTDDTTTPKTIASFITDTCEEINSFRFNQSQLKKKN